MIMHVCCFHTYFTSTFITILLNYQKKHDDLNLSRNLPGLALFWVAPSFLDTAAFEGFASTLACPISPSLFIWGMHADICLSRELASGKLVLQHVQ